MTLADRQQEDRVRGGTPPRYLATSNGAGHLVYVNQGNAVRGPVRSGQAGDARDGRARAGRRRLQRRTSGPAQLDFSAHRHLGVPQRQRRGRGLLTVAWLDGAGKTQPLLAKPGAYARPSLSPDGQRLALEVTEGSGTDIWVYDWQRDTMTRLTFTGNSPAPVWSPDGRYIVFRAVGAGTVCDPFRRIGQAAAIDAEQERPDSVVLHARRKAAGVLGVSVRNRIRSVDRADGERRRGAAGRKAGGFPANAGRRAIPCFLSRRTVAGLCFRTSRGRSRFMCERFRTKAASGKSRTAAARTRCGRATGASCSSRRLDNHIMVAAYTVKGDSFVADKPRMWSEKQIAGVVTTAKNCRSRARRQAHRGADAGRGTGERKRRRTT